MKCSCSSYIVARVKVMACKWEKTGKYCTLFPFFFRVGERVCAVLGCV